VGEAKSSLARKVQLFTIALDIALIVLVIAWQLTDGVTVPRLLLGVALTLPLLAPLVGLYRANRRTFAWTTLCVIPYFVIGITEAVARPDSRAWTGSCLLLALTLFVALIAYIRLTRE